VGITKAAILVLSSALIAASGGCAHNAEKPKGAASAQDKEAAGSADAKRFQEIMDMLYKMKPPAREPESVPGADNGVFAPAKTDKAAEIPKEEPQQESGDRK
jgi:hypothetical protein